METPSKNPKSRCHQGKTMDSHGMSWVMPCPTVKHVWTQRESLAKIPISRPSARSFKLTCKHASCAGECQYHQYKSKMGRLPTSIHIHNISEYFRHSTSTCINPHLSIIIPHPSSSFRIYSHHSASARIYAHLSTSFQIYPHLSTSFHIYPHQSTSFCSRSSFHIHPHSSRMIPKCSQDR